MGETGILARILERLAALGMELEGERRRERLGTFVREAALWSGRIHLVGKRHIRRNLVQLFADSWLMYLFASERGILAGGARVADLGSGAGFPGLVWKIFEPDLEVTLFERREKTARFLERVVSKMGLEGIRVVCGDAGESDGFAPFDIALSKAAGRLSELSPLLPRLMREDGFYLTVKGAGWRGELDAGVERILHLEASRELPEGRGEIVLFSLRFT